MLLRGKKMKYGFVFPRVDIFNSIKFAQKAEKTGWDAFFVWEPTYGIDAWISLAAIAVKTEKIRLGTLLSPISRMRPWKIASEAITLDILSHGRITLCVGLGAIDTGFKELGEEIDRTTRAELLDESLEIIKGLWTRKLSSYEGKHYKITNLLECEFFKRHPMPELNQFPSIPIWVVGAWPRKKSMERTLSYEGIIPTIKNNQGKFEDITPKHISDIKSFFDERFNENSIYDIVIEGVTPGDDPEAANSIIEPFAKAGATWWIESDWDTLDLNQVYDRVKQGPPSYR